MAKVNCPGCQSLVTFDPKEETEFPCPACGKQLRVKKPVKAPPAFAPKPKPIAVATIREPVEEEEEEDDLQPVRRKKKKRFRGPSGRVSSLLMPLGGLATLLLIGLIMVIMNHEAEKEKAQIGGGAYLVALVVAAIAIAVGGFVTQYSVNSLSRRGRVPSIEFSEAMCLYPLVALSGLLGALLMMVPMILFSIRNDGVPGRDDYFGVKLATAFILVVLGFVGATMTTIKYLLDTRWKDAGSISARFVVVGFLTNIAINMVMAAVIAVVKSGDMR